jgi:hypothetical protein
MVEYTKTVEGASTFTDGNILEVDRATITVKESSTAVFAGLTCSGSANLTCEGTFIFGSTLVIDKLVCLDATITVSTSSTVDIKNIEASGTVTVVVKDASTLRLRAGNINVINGNITTSSTGVCRATIKRDDVQTSSASTWDARL